MKATFNDLISSDTPTLIDFYADWCGPCKMQGPILQDLSKEMGDKVRIVKIDVDKNQAISGQLQVRNIPTLMMYKSGKQVWRKAGVSSKDELVGVVEQFS